MLGDTLVTVSSTLPEPMGKAVRASLGCWREAGKIRRLWAHDASLWTGKDEGKWLAWLDIVADRTADLAQLQAFQDEVKARRVHRRAVAGHGRVQPGAGGAGRDVWQARRLPQLHVLDSTDPQQIASSRRRSRWRPRWSSCPASPAARWSRTSSRPISSTPCKRRSGRQGRAAFRRHHRPAFAHAESGGGGQDGFRTSSTAIRHRRPLFRAVEFRHGPGGGDGAGPGAVPGVGRADGAGLRRGHAAVAEPRRATRHRARASARPPAATR